MTTQPTPHNQQQPRSSSSGGIWNVIGIVVLVILGAAAVLLFGVLMGQTLGQQETVPENAPTVAPPADLPPTMQPYTPYLITTANVNVRSGPSTEYPSYGVAQQGKSFSVTGVSSDCAWWVLEIPEAFAPDGLGWISADYAEAYFVDNVPVVKPPELPPEVPDVPTPAPDTATATTMEPLNVRSGPGNTYPSYGKVSSGTIFEVIGKSEDGRFWVVSIPTSIAPDGQGWSSAAYCETENTDNVPVVAPPPPP